MRKVEYFCRGTTGVHEAMISLLKKRLRDQTLTAVDLYAKTLNHLENKSDLNAFVHINRDGADRAEDSHKRLQKGNWKNYIRKKRKTEIF